MERHLAGAEKYYASIEAQKSTRTLSAAQKKIALANTVPIHDVLADYLGLEVPQAWSFKAHCPFGAEHPDGGLEKGWRAYAGTNSSFCFVLHGFMDPVQILALAHGVSRQRAAGTLIDHYRLGRTHDYRKRFAEIQKESKIQTGGPDPLYVTQALQVALRTNPAYVQRQFDPEVQSGVAKALAALDWVCVEEPDRIRGVLERAKNEVFKLLERKEAS